MLDFDGEASSNEQIAPGFGKQLPSQINLLLTDSKLRV